MMFVIDAMVILTLALQYPLVNLINYICVNYLEYEINPLVLKMWASIGIVILTILVLAFVYFILYRKISKTQTADIIYERR